MEPTNISLSRTYVNFGGVDIRVLIDGKVHNNIQAVSVNAKEDSTHVDIVVLCLDACGLLPTKISSVVLVAANEYGRSSILYGLEDLTKQNYQIDIAVDDLVVEEKYVYRTERFVSGNALVPTNLEKISQGKSILDVVSESVLHHKHDLTKAFNDLKERMA